jgi:hypothetical protein
MNIMTMKETFVVLAIAGLFTGVALAYGERVFTDPSPPGHVVTRSVVCDESSSLLSASDWEIDVTTDVTGGVKLRVGDLKNRCVPRPIIGALAYLMAWSRGEPRPVNGNTFSLVLPTSGLHLSAQVSLDRATVRILKSMIRGGEKIFRGTLTMELIYVDEYWQVAVVTMP